jgi:hypothetical protein
MKKPSPKPKPKPKKSKETPPQPESPEAILKRLAELDALMQNALDAGDYIRARDLADDQEELLEKLT